MILIIIMIIIIIMNIIIIIKCLRTYGHMPTGCVAVPLLAAW